MRILILTATYTPSVNGVAISVALQKNELEKLGHEVYVIAPKHQNSVPEKNVFLLPSLSNPLESDYPIFLPIPNTEILKILPKKPDLIYFQHPFIVGEIALLMAKLYKCPAVFYYHTQYELYSKIYTKNLIPSAWAVKITKKFLKNILNRTDHIIVGSPAFAKLLNKDKIKTPHSIIPITRKLISTQNKHRENIVLCVTRVSKVKNIEVLLQIYSKINSKKWKLIIAGDGQELNKYKIRYPKINFLGKIPHHEIHKIYEKAKIFAFPSKSEVQPGVIFEALNAGLPIVAFNAPGPKDFTVHQKNSLLAKNNREFEIYLKKMMNDNKLREKYGKTSKILSKEYALEKSIKKIEELFKRLAISTKISATA